MGAFIGIPAPVTRGGFFWMAEPFQALEKATLPLQEVFPVPRSLDGLFAGGRGWLPAEFPRK